MPERATGERNHRCQEVRQSKADGTMSTASTIDTLHFLLEGNWLICLEMNLSIHEGDVFMCDVHQGLSDIHS